MTEGQEDLIRYKISRADEFVNAIIALIKKQ